MNLLIDVGAIKTGGGVQLALNFIDLLSEFSAHKTVTLLAPQSGPLADYPFDERRFTVYHYPDNYAARFLFELTQLKTIVVTHRITHCYTFFGAGLRRLANVKSIVSTAYPIICYPDSMFWQYADRRTYWRNRVNNFLRRHRLRQADRIIVETPVMRERIAKQLGYAKERIDVLPPVPSRYLQANASAKMKADEMRFVLLSGCETHKNLWRLPEIALELDRRGLQSYRFRLTTSESAFIAQPRINPTVWDQVKHRFEFIGHVNARDIQTVYEGANFLMNLSDLESFSNNYMEAWKAGLPIVASDRDFSRHICGESAVYVEPHAPAFCAKVIIDLINDLEMQKRMCAAATQKLHALGDERTRFRTVMDIVAAV